MIKIIIVALVLIIAFSIWAFNGSDLEKWPAIIVTLLLVIELISWIYRDDFNFFHEITSAEIVLILIFLWLIAIAPHADKTCEKSKKTKDTADQNKQAGSNSSLF